MLKSLSLAFALFAASSSAFAPTQSNNALSSLRMSDDAVELVEPTITIEESASTLSAQSQALPFMSRPMALDGSLAGDVGFDPLGFAKNSDDLMNYREAEVSISIDVFVLNSFISVHLSHPLAFYLSH